MITICHAHHLFLASCLHLTNTFHPSLHHRVDAWVQWLLKSTAVPQAANQRSHLIHPSTLTNETDEAATLRLLLWQTHLTSTVKTKSRTLEPFWDFSYSTIFIFSFSRSRTADLAGYLSTSECTNRITSYHNVNFQFLIPDYQHSCYFIICSPTQRQHSHALLYQLLWLLLTLCVYTMTKASSHYVKSLHSAQCTLECSRSDST